MARLSLIYIALLVLGGCASFDVNKVQAALDAHDCKGAENILIPPALKGDKEAINNLGVVYQRCYNDRQKAITYYTLAARKGNDTARMNLIALGAPVPRADLVDQDSGPLPQPPVSNNINCMSTAAGSTVTTNCH